MPQADLPFDGEFLQFASDSLCIAEIAPDRAWLNWPEPDTITQLMRGEQKMRWDAAREAIPKSAAQWEQAAFIQPAFWSALSDLQRGKISSFREFEFLYCLLLGEASKLYVPPVFAAAALSPSLDREFGLQLMATIPT